MTSTSADGSVNKTTFLQSISRTCLFSVCTHLLKNDHSLQQKYSPCSTFTHLWRSCGSVSAGQRRLWPGSLQTGQTVPWVVLRCGQSDGRRLADVRCCRIYSSRRADGEKQQNVHQRPIITPPPQKQSGRTQGRYLEEERSERDLWQFHHHGQQTVDHMTLCLRRLLQVILIIWSKKQLLEGLMRNVHLSDIKVHLSISAAPCGQFVWLCLL